MAASLAHTARSMLSHSHRTVVQRCLHHTLASLSATSTAAISRTHNAHRPAALSSLPHRRHFSAGIVQHRDVEGNKQDDTFTFNAENQQKIKTILAKFPSNYKQSATIPLLTLAQEQNNNWLTLAAMNEVAKILNLPPIRVYEVATFYSQFNREKVGKYHLQVCGTTPCQLRGSEAIIDTITQHVGIKRGETSADGNFTMVEVECLGACCNAPMIQINNHEFYENLTPESTRQLLDDLKAGKKPKVGPQNGQQSCEGPDGNKTLKEDVDIKAQFRDLDAAFKEAKAAAEKAKQEAEAKKAQAKA